MCELSHLLAEKYICFTTLSIFKFAVEIKYLVGSFVVHVDEVGTLVTSLYMI